MRAKLVDNGLIEIIWTSHIFSLLKLAHDDRHAIWVLQRCGLQSRTANFIEVDAIAGWLDWRNVPTGPQVDAEMVMIAIPREEIGLTRYADHQCHAQGLIKGLAVLQVPDVQMHVTKTQATGEAVERLRFLQ